jgi:apolipoprotein N-acyltransferase
VRLVSPVPAASGGPPVPAAPAPPATVGNGEPGWRAARHLLRGPLRTLVAGQCLGQAGDGVAQVAFAQFVVFDVGRGASAPRVAGLLAVTLLPFSLVGPFAGVLIDSWSRRRVLVDVSLIRAVTTLAAIGTVIAGWEAGAVAGLLLLLSTSRFVLAAKGAVLPRMVRRQELVTANAVSSVAGMSAAFAGAVAAAGFVGRSAAAGFVVASLLYTGAAAVFTRLADVGGGGRRADRDALRRLRHAAADLAVGLRTIAGTADIGRPLVAVGMHRFLVGAGFVLFVLAADSGYRLRIAGYGLALAVTGVAAFAGTVTAPVLDRRWGPAALLPVAFLPPAVLGYAAGVTPGLGLLLAGLAVTGFSFQALKVLVDAMVGGACRDAVRGRVFAAYDVLYNVAFVLAGLAMVPLWHPSRVRGLLWLIAAGFAAGWLVCARMLHAWPMPGAALPAPRRGAAWPGRGAAVLAGAGLAAAFPAPALWWWAWIGLVPLLLLVRAAPGPREGAVRAWCGAAGYLATAAYWLVPDIGPALALVAGGLGLLWAPWGWAAHRLLAGRPGLAATGGALAVLPAGWVVIEAVRSWPSLAGPWVLLGASQWNQPRLLASAAVGGVWLTGLLIVTVNVAVVVVIVVGRPAARLLAAVTLSAALAVGPAWASVRGVPPGRGAVRIAVIQPGAVLGPAQRLALQEQLTRAVAPEHPDLVVWGESSVGYDLGNRPDVGARLTTLAAQSHADLLVNIDALRGRTGIYKSAVLITPAGPDGHYDKSRLVPFGEYIPFRNLLGWVSQISKAAKENRQRGRGPVVLHIGALRVGPLICFESTFPDMARREAQLGAQLIVYQAATTTFQGSWAQPQHASLAAVRAVETGRPVLHAALTGTTAAFDATGRRLLWIPAGRTAHPVVTIPLVAGQTPYDVAGDWVLALSMGVLGCAVTVASLRAGRQPVVAVAQFAAKDLATPTIRGGV